MRLEFWLTTSATNGSPVGDEAMAFTNGWKKIFLVENQAEYDLVYALQFIYGGETQIQILPKATWFDVTEFRRDYDVIYTSWDPFDRNRI